MRLVTVAASPRGRPGALIGDEVLDFAAAGGAIPLAARVPDSVVDILGAGDEGLALARAVVRRVEDASETDRDRLRGCGALRPLAGARLLAPVPRPGLIVSSGMAYAKHLEEMGVPIPRHPVGFIKSSHAVIGPGAPIVLPQEFPDMVDLEGEFAFVLGRACHRVGAGEALDYVAGYTIVNDVSARNWVEEFLASKDPFFNILGKQLPTFCPMGPALVTPEEVPDPHGLDLTTTLNGEVMQSANTRDLLFTVADLIAFYSRWYAFQPGDVITTGSPPGVGYGRDPKVFMKPGDVVSVTIDRLGTLSNAVVAG